MRCLNCGCPLDTGAADPNRCPNCRAWIARPGGPEMAAGPIASTVADGPIMMAGRPLASRSAPETVLHAVAGGPFSQERTAGQAPGAHDGDSLLAIVLRDLAS